MGTGVSGGLFFSSFRRRASRFFSSVRRKTLIVVRKDLLGLQSSPATGVCSQTGQDEGRVNWPIIINRASVQVAGATHRSHRLPVRNRGVGRR